MSTLVIDTDSYKASHFLQYPPKTEAMSSYIESRGGRWEQTVFFGLQYILKKYFTDRVTHADVDEAKEFFAAHGEPFPEEGWRHIVNHHGGKIPVRIKAVAEGSVVPTGNVLLTIESTDPKTFWVVSWLETQLMRIWYPVTVATQSFYCKRQILDFLYRTSDIDPFESINFKLHDFGARGVSSQESAGIGGAAHLVNFMGSDTVAGVLVARKYYNTPMAAFSIPAAEHSTMTSWGGREGERHAMENMIDTFGGKGKILACVSDSYSHLNAVKNIWGGTLKEKVINNGAKLVVRPDSGNPAQIVTATLEALGEKFGFTVNKKGYKLLPPYLGVIQGDGINESSIQDILATMTRNGWCADNVNFGMGGALLQQVNRDTQKFAMKCSWLRVDGQDREVFKEPETDPGKRSKAGRIDLDLTEKGEYVTVPDGTAKNSQLRTVFENGELLIDENLDTIRARTIPAVKAFLWGAAQAA